ncbi:hypothetical protein CPB86DRAFT_398026 [Serendipita vermifera]|nr:hypothetical protein CPB86DRAFT_398026 [Serendipita vermifera]
MGTTLLILLGLRGWWHHLSISQVSPILYLPVVSVVHDVLPHPPKPPIPLAPLSYNICPPISLQSEQVLPHCWEVGRERGKFELYDARESPLVSSSLNSVIPILTLFSACVCLRTLFQPPIPLPFADRATRQIPSLEGHCDRYCRHRLPLLSW